MIEISNNSLVFSFPEVHPSAKLRISLQRTLRIPDDDKDYPLPPGLGAFPLRHVDDFAPRVPPSWIEHGGIMLPMFQSEAMWLSFNADYDDERCATYPFAVKIATGKINAVSGRPWTGGLHRQPQQDYVVVPKQPWLDGYCVKKGVSRPMIQIFSSSSRWAVAMRKWLAFISRWITPVTALFRPSSRFRHPLIWETFKPRDCYTRPPG